MPVTPFTLRDHFPPVSTASWIRAIQEIGSDPGSLHWVRDGIKLRLFYRASDSAVAQRIDATPGWEKCQRIDAAEYGSSTGNLIGLVQDGSMAVNVQTARGARFDGKSREFVKQLTAAGLAVHWTGPVSGIVEVMRESVRDPSLTSPFRSATNLRNSPVAIFGPFFSGAMDGEIYRIG